MFYRTLLSLHQGLFDLAMAAANEPVPSLSILQPAPATPAEGSANAGGSR